MDAEPFFEREKEGGQRGERFEMKKKLVRVYGGDGDKAPLDLHVPRTLDQSYYLSLLDSRSRDEDQVVTRFYARKGEAPKALMVGQLWIWRIDSSMSRFVLL